MIEVIFIIVIAIAVWLFIHFRKKGHESEVDSVVEPVVTQTITPEPEPEPEPEQVVVPESSPVVQVSESLEVVETNDAVDVMPEDSALRRHYLQNLVTQDENPTDTVTVGAVSEEIVEISAPKENIAEVAKGVSHSPLSIPEDAALKRHFIQQLTAEIAAAMPARPTDSTLKRHYDAQLASSVLSQLDMLK